MFSSDASLHYIQLKSKWSLVYFLPRRIEGEDFLAFELCINHFYSFIVLDSTLSEILEGQHLNKNWSTTPLYILLDLLQILSFIMMWRLISEDGMYSI